MAVEDLAQHESLTPLLLLGFELLQKQEETRSQVKVSLKDCQTTKEEEEKCNFFHQGRIFLLNLNDHFCLKTGHRDQSY